MVFHFNQFNIHEFVYSCFRLYFQQHPRKNWNRYAPKRMLKSMCHMHLHFTDTLKIESNRIVSCRKSEFTAKRTGRPFSQYAYDIKLKNAHTEKENFGFTADNSNKIDNKTLVNGGPISAQLWYRDVVELRKKAEEYKVRCACLQSFRLFLFWNVHFCFCFALESWLGHWDQSGTL